MSDRMVEDTTKGGKPEENKDTYLAKLFKLGYPLADVAGEVNIIEHPKSDRLTLGFRDANGRGQIALSARKEEWRLWAEDLLKKLTK